MCDEIDTIFGSWTIVRPAKDCNDMQMSIETRHDKLRRTKLSEMKEVKMRKSGTSLIND